MTARITIWWLACMVWIWWATHRFSTPLMLFTAAAATVFALLLTRSAPDSTVTRLGAYLAGLLANEAPGMGYAVSSLLPALTPRWAQPQTIGRPPGELRRTRQWRAAPVHWS